MSPVTSYDPKTVPPRDALDPADAHSRFELPTTPAGWPVSHPAEALLLAYEQGFENGIERNLKPLVKHHEVFLKRILHRDGEGHFLHPCRPIRVAQMYEASGDPDRGRFKQKLAGRGGHTLDELIVLGDEKLRNRGWRQAELGDLFLELAKAADVRGDTIKRLTIVMQKSILALVYGAKGQSAMQLPL